MAEKPAARSNPFAPSRLRVKIRRAEPVHFVGITG
jgi:hypothetical protein